LILKEFTPDLMPSDILGSEILDENRQFKFIKGLYSNIILADEINNNTKNTSGTFSYAERAVTIAGENHKLDFTLFCFSNAKAIEQKETYCLGPS
jgi:MoxR-like ATPase